MLKHLFAAALAAAVLTLAAPPPAHAARVTDFRMPVVVQGVDYDLAARVYRPAGPGPFPLIVIHHGTPADKRKLADTRLGFARAARWFAAHGDMVVVALRPGYGNSSGRYLEGAGNCHDVDFVVAGRKIAAAEAAIVEAAARLPGVDPQRIIVVGQSAGGLGAVALADAPPPGVRGVISFAGGRGSNGKEVICAGEDRLIEAEKTLGAANTLPQLWLYAENDHFFRRELAHRMYAAYRAGSTPPVAFADLPPFGDDGHKTFAQADPSVWARPVAAFLAQVLSPAAGAPAPASASR
ncbi:dienelactone hydrolase family protein [Xanthomonas sp. CFBP 8445]|uniref:alpha/beta hydrolase family protein n=1 Tax=Xanthomonas sp. CFBP 8445 TaxID=2971236 RepID=UPI0021DFBE3B|nr:dienelactone hydrolase family protein [Xanthomonas sp. CFBP 8445]UYC11258.1 dienelactone hydrolase family protein [Xanthomonas sp. CFBP 8445]